ncbi:hypothetical protein FKM82_025549 [Ascaphus truei]
MYCTVCNNCVAQCVVRCAATSRAPSTVTGQGGNVDSRLPYWRRTPGQPVTAGLPRQAFADATMAIRHNSAAVELGERAEGAFWNSAPWSSCALPSHTPSASCAFSRHLQQRTHPLIQHIPCTASGDTTQEGGAWEAAADTPPPPLAHCQGSSGAVLCVETDLCSYYYPVGSGRCFLDAAPCVTADNAEDEAAPEEKQTQGIG